MTSPAPGYVFKSTSQTFTWSTGTGVLDYWLEIVGSTGIVHSQYQGTGLRALVDNLPTDGRTLVARIYSRIGGVWQSTETVYRAAAPRAAWIRVPYPGTSLTTSTSVTFAWDWTALGATEYWLEVYAGPLQIYSRSEGLATARLVSGIPTDGRPIQAYLYSRIDGEWQLFSAEYATGPNEPAQILMPASGSRVTLGASRIAWTRGIGKAEYYVTIGTVPGGSDILSQYQGQSQWTTVNLAEAGGPLWARVYSRLSSWWAWEASADVSFWPGTGGGPAQIVAPPSGSKLLGQAAFTWTSGSGATSYVLSVGTAQGLADLFTSGTTTAQQASVSGLPVDGGTIWVRLSSQIAGVWQHVDYTYSGDPLTIATLWRATAGLYGVNLDIDTFLRGYGHVRFYWWPADNAEGYWLDIGRCRGGYEVLSRPYSANQLDTLEGVSIPTDEQPIWVRLWSRIGGTWHFVDRDFVTGHDYYMDQTNRCFWWASFGDPEFWVHCWVPRYPVCQ